MFVQELDMLAEKEVAGLVEKDDELDCVVGDAGPVVAMVAAAEMEGVEENPVVVDKEMFLSV